MSRFTDEGVLKQISKGGGYNFIRMVIVVSLSEHCSYLFTVHNYFHTHTHTHTHIYISGSVRNVFTILNAMLTVPRLHLFDQKYSKTFYFN